MKRSEIKAHLARINESVEAIKAHVPYSSQLIQYTQGAMASIDNYGYQVEFMKNLPKFFSRADGNIIADSMGMKHDTFWRYVRFVQKKGWVKRSGHTWSVLKFKF